MDGTTSARRRRAVLLALALLLSALPLAAATCRAGGYVGESDGYTTANVSLDALCRWNHDIEGKDDDGNGVWARNWPSCSTRRSIYQTCELRLYADPAGRALYEGQSHGQDRCNTFLRGDCSRCYQARGSAAMFYYRLDNPQRRWGRGYVTGDGIWCDKALLPSGQHRMKCVHLWGNPPIGLASALSTAHWKALASACTARYSEATQETCERVARRVYAGLSRAERERILARIERR